MITKTDFRKYLEAPMHIWASKHGQIEVGPSLYDQHLMKQGHDVELLARDFLHEHLFEVTDVVIHPEVTFLDDDFQARVDILARYPEEGVIDIYEIKSSKPVKKEDLYDAAFQHFVCEANETVLDIYLVYLNKEYVRRGGLDLSSLFVIENINEDAETLREEVLLTRDIARQVAALEKPAGIQPSGKPKDCPCPSLCHGNLLYFSSFDFTTRKK